MNIRLVKALIIHNDLNVINQLTRFAIENALIIDICGFSTDFEEGIEMINIHKPDLVFLDPTDNNLLSFNLVKELPINIPKFIFISENENKAYKAFQYNAIDFIKKNFDFDELIISVYKVIKLIEMEISFQNDKVNQASVFSSETYEPKFIAVSSSDKIELIKFDEILYCKADGKYTEFILSTNNKVLSSKNLGEYSSHLFQNCFFRIHHSYVVNVNKIDKITKKDGLYCEFTNGLSIPVAKRRQEEFLKFLKL